MTDQTLTYLYRFFGFWQLIVCGFAFIALLSIWRHITKGKERESNDNGLLWLSLSVLVWACSGIVDIVQATQGMSLTDSTQSSTFEGLRSSMSILNSAFILLALPCFKHIPIQISELVRSKLWRWLVMITFLFAVVMTLLMVMKVVVPRKATFIYIIDLMYAIFTLLFLGMTLWASFEKRNLKTMAYLSVLCIGLTLTAQFLKLEEAAFWKLLFNCTFKTVLIMLFFALALSWVKELAMTTLPKPEEMHLVLLKQKNSTAKQHYSAIVTIPPQLQTQQIFFTRKAFELLYLFAERRKEQDHNNGWLEIQPKSANKDKVYDISDHNQVTRILDQILNTTKGADKWSIESDRNPLRMAMFESSANRRIRLRIKSQNIIIS